MLVSLVGLPGVGKSVIGRRLATRLAYSFVDSDALVEARLGESIRSFFEREGEERFRDVEEAVLAEIASRDRTVIATGGGCVIRDANRKLLRERTRCVYLHTSADILFERLRGDRKRPLLQVADPLRRLRELGDARDPLYREVAIITIETGRGSSHAAVASIAAQLLSASDDPADAGGSSR